MRTLYFDIDGTLLDINDEAKPALRGGALQRALIDRRVERLVCVSGWADLVRLPAAGVRPWRRSQEIYQLVATVFPDERWFLERLVVGENTDHRGHLIDRSLDWWYADDNADEYFGAAFGAQALAQEIGRRICLPRWDSDGEELLEWVMRMAR